MTTAIEYALMAGASYRSNRDAINRFPIPAEWSEITGSYRNLPSGFEAVAFTKGNEIVISFAGTEPTQLGDMATNLSLASGALCDQLRQAADYYLQVKASAPAGTKISLTGHSLGGGLASLIAVMFGESAFTFDQAPFLNSAKTFSSTNGETGNTITRSAAIDLRAYLADHASNDMLAKLDAYIAASEPFNPSPNPADTLSARGAQVININTQGEFLSSWFLMPTSNRIGSQTEIRNSSDGVGGLDMHSQALLTAFLQSNQSAITNANGQVQSLSEVTFKLTDLLKMVFDEKLFAFATSKADENLLERLVKHEAGIGTTLAADQMLTRLTADLWKLAQDGGMTLKDGNSNTTWVSRALTAFAMQMYYEDTANATNKDKQLFDVVTGGIRFDMADVSQKFKTAFDNGQALTLTDAKGYDQYFKYYLDNNLDINDVNFNLAETVLIKSLLPYMRDWYVQAGTSGLATTDDKNRGAFMLGGTGSDKISSGGGDDFITAWRGGDDVLDTGKAMNDSAWRIAA